VRHAFEPFFTTKAKGEGTGLGLGISRQIVAKHGGELRCVSVPGRTCFEVRLPIASSGAGA
jgi:signal transduction histidine kinase